MIKLNVTKSILPMETSFQAIKTAAELVESANSGMSKAASDSITAIQQGIINAKSKILDKYSDACQYFGVDSAHNIIQKIENQVYLTVMKCKEIGCIDSFPKGAGFSINDSWSMENCCNIIRKTGQFADLYDKPARITFYGKVFGQNGEEGAHTIGILYYPASKTLYVLDSLPNSFREVKEYQNILRKRIFEPMQDECKNIIFSNKAQQNLNEYSCNNWALANIEALQKALKEGKTIDSVEKLNEVLPDDINKILEEQYEYIGKSF